MERRRGGFVRGKRRKNRERKEKKGMREGMRGKKWQE